MIARSMLYVPGNRSDRMVRALELSADAVIADLEDAVAPDAKKEARIAISEWLTAIPSGAPDIWVRLNPVEGEEAEAVRADVDAVVSQQLSGVCLAKFASEAELVFLDQLLADKERERGIAIGHTRIALLIESAKGIRAIDRMDESAVSRLHQLHMGEVDLGADLNLSRGPNELEFLPARWQVVLSSVLLEIETPMGPPSVDFRDLEALRASTEALFRLGFGGRAAIHPDQIEVINKVFTPTDEEIALAKDTIERFDDSIANGEGALVDANNRLVDLAVIRSARRVVELSERHL